MKTISLSVTGTKYRGLYAAIVDDCDYEALSVFNWTACVQGSAENRRVYAFRQEKVGATVVTTRMQRAVWARAYGAAPAGREIDHVEPGVNGGLDNRRSNLRLTDKSKNQANSRKGRNNTSGYKGVWWQAQARRWRCDIWVRRQKTHLGYFTDKVSAALAYDAAARAAFGEHARPNFPELGAA